MKIYIGKPNNWFGPYQLAETLCFWAKKDVDEYGFEHTADWVHDFGEFLAHGFTKQTEEQKKRWFNNERPKTWLYKFLEWVHAKKIEPKYIKIDYWDTWSMDHTLSPIILPMLKQLKATKHGYGMIDDEDVPEELRSTNAPPHSEYEWDGNAEKRYEYVLDEMIFAFEHLVDDSWEDAYRSGEIDHIWIPVDAQGNEVPKGEHKYMQMAQGPNHTYVCDYDGIKKVNDRIDAGLKLFGKYFRTLWD